MENVEMEKEWFVTHEGKQFGPVSMDDLKFEAERGQLNPRLDMVWRKDMDDWIPAGDLEGLFEKNVEAAAVEKAKENPAPIVPTEQKTDKQKKIESAQLQGEWGGTSRGTYLVVCYVLPFLLMAGIGAAGVFLQGKVGDNMLAIGGVGLMLVLGIVALVATVNRFTNLAMTRWWFLSLFVPILSLWTYYRLFACPAGYAEHKKLDRFGWVLAIIYWLFFLLVAAFFAVVIYFSTTDPDKFKELFGKQTEQFSEIMEQAQERSKQLKQEEPPAPKPSITPY